MTKKELSGKGQLSGEDERLLIQRVKAGDQKAFEAIFNHYVSRVYRQAFKFVGNEADAEDVVQDVFLLVYRKANSFLGKSEFSTWLYRLTANAALTKLRQRKKQKEVSLDEYLPKFRKDGHHLVRPVVDWTQEVDKFVAIKEYSQIIKEAMEKLSPMDKAVVVMSDMEEMSNPEISATLGITVQAVKARLHRARLFLRGKFTAQLGYSPT
ncbi:MAG TPA: sigma-70 family RNA polymerase sigma factor [Thermodesulfobacteriota bacterium]|nr:sigma-70 family RNA polymerase sigma factor [Thermodesulfobacteriota bacterium]